MKEICMGIIVVAYCIVAFGLFCWFVVSLCIPALKDHLYPPCTNCKHYAGNGCCNKIADKIYDKPASCVVAREKLGCKFKSKD